MQQYSQQPKSVQAGFSTLELLIAFAILTLSMTAVILVVFGNQAVAVDTELAQRGLYIAEHRLETAGASTITDFDSVVSELSPSPESTIFDSQVTVSDISECAKRITSTVYWNRNLRSLQSSLSSIYVNPQESLQSGNDCETTEPSGDWDAPKFYTNPEIIHPGSTATDVDVIKNDHGTFALITSTKNGTNETFWIVDVSDPDNPSQILAYDTGDDVLAIDAYTTDDIAYAFLATASSTAQLYVVEIDLNSYPSNDPTLATSTASLPGVGGTDPEGRAITYYNDQIFIGTRRTLGPEFHIFDVSTPLSPQHTGSIELNHSINALDLRQDIAYVAATAQTPAGCELILLDISNPSAMTNPCTPGSTAGNMNYRAPGNYDATAVVSFGNRTYLGREQAGSDNNFYILDTSDPQAVTAINSINLDLNPNTEVVGLAVHANLAFIATSDQNPNNGGGPFMVYDIENPLSIRLVSTCPLNFAEMSTALRYFNNTVYVTNSANDALRILYPSPVCSS